MKVLTYVESALKSEITMKKKHKTLKSALVMMFWIAWWIVVIKLAYDVFWLGMQ